MKQILDRQGLAYFWSKIKTQIGITSVSVSVDNNIGTPTAIASLLNGVLTIIFQNLKGEKGDKGDTVILGDEQEYTLYDELGENTDGAVTQAKVTDLYNTLLALINALVESIAQKDADHKLMEQALMDMIMGNKFPVKVIGEGITPEPFYMVDNEGSFALSNLPAAGYAINTITITMNEEDITQESYSDGMISIPRVTGNVTINVETSSVTDTNMFTKRTTANGLQVLNNKALLKGIRGNTFIWNQRMYFGGTVDQNSTTLVEELAYGTTANASDIYISGKYKRLTYAWSFSKNSLLTVGHKYLFSAKIKFPDNPDLQRARFYLGDLLNKGNIDSTYSWVYLTNGEAVIQKIATARYTRLGVSIYHNSDNSNYNWIPSTQENISFILNNFEVIDLTTMFGAGKEPTSATDVLKLFPSQPYDRTTFTLVNNAMTNYISKKYDAVGVTPVNSTNTEWTDAPVSGAAPTVTPVDGIFTITVKSNNRAIIRSRNSIGASGKVYYWACYVKAPTGNFHFGNNGASISSVTLKHDGWERVSRINNGAITRCEFQVRDATIGDTIQFKNLIYVSLTDMFGAGNEPTIAECNVIFDSIQNWQTANAFNNWNLLDRIGKSTNIWDEQAEKGYIDASGNLVNGNYLRSINFIPVTPNTRIYWNYSSGGTYDVQIARYDDEKTFIEKVGAVGSYLIPSDTYYIKFYCHGNYGTSYRNNVILSTRPAPVYEPYNKVSAIDVTNATGKLNGEGDSLVIFPDGMKSTVCLPSVTPTYIYKSDGVASYFDLDYVPTGNDIVIKTKIRYTSYIGTNNYLPWFTTKTSGWNETTGDNFYGILRRTNTNGNIYAFCGNKNYTEITGLTTATVYEIELSNGNLNLNGTDYTLDTTVGNENTYSMKLLNGINCYFYYFQIYKAGELVVDCIPYRNGDVVGLYDRARDRVFTLIQASDKGVITSYEPTYEELPEPVYDEIKQDNGVWKAYKRISNIRVENAANTGRGEYAPLAQEEVYVLDDQSIPTELTVANQGTEEMLPTNGTTPVTAPTILEVQYGAIPNLLGGGLLGGMLGGSNNGGGSDDEEQEEEEPDYEEELNNEEEISEEEGDNFEEETTNN